MARNRGQAPKEPVERTPEIIVCEIEKKLGCNNGGADCLNVKRAASRGDLVTINADCARLARCGDLDPELAERLIDVADTVMTVFTPESSTYGRIFSGFKEAFTTMVPATVVH